MASISKPARAVSAWAFLVLAGCAGPSELRQAPGATEYFTVTAEMALARGEPRRAALQYAAAVQNDPDPKLLRRAAEVATQTLQPSVASQVADRWLAVEPGSAEAQRTAARAALALYRINDAAAHYRGYLADSANLDARVVEIESDLTGGESVFGARALADRLARLFPDSWEVLRVQGITALRADDPASAARSLSNAVSAESRDGNADAAGEKRADTHRELQQSLWRARILSGDAEQPLAEARARMEGADTPENRYEYAVLLLSAQRYDESARQLELLAAKPETAAAATRTLGLIDFQQGQFESAEARFRKLVSMGKFMDDASYYLGVIADRGGDAEHALRFYAQVQHGDNVLPALLRATALLYAHGAPGAAEDLMNRLMVDEPQRMPEILNARVRLYADAGELERAAALLDAGLAEYPDAVELHYARASLFEEQGKVNDALHELAALVQARPDDPAALNALGFTLADHSRDLRKARRLIERAHAAAPRNAAILDSLGWVLFRQGRDREALPYLHEAYADDRSGDIAAHLGEVLWKGGDRDAAQRIWSEASVVDADSKLLRITRQRLQAAN